jgi:hypothetical protein
MAKVRSTKIKKKNIGSRIQVERANARSHAAQKSKSNKPYDK